MITKKHTIIALTIGILLLSIIVALVVSNQPTQTEQTNKTNVVKFNIDGLDDPKYLFSSDKQVAIVTGIEQYLLADDIKTDGLQGIIRDDSYTQKEEGGASVVTILIDIPNVKRTYKIWSSGSGRADGNNSLFILCPSEDELIYATFKCKDDTI